LGLTAVLASVAVAQPAPGASGSGVVTAQGSLDKTSPADPASDQADAQAKAEARAKLDAIVQRGQHVSARSRTDAETKLEASATQVEAEATGHGDATV